ncbi:MAG: very short patch repair endonuclease [Gemmataceae bacterium]
MLHHERVSARMRAVRQANTGAELRVRRVLHALGYRFRLHRIDLPGKPDIVLPKYKAVIFVHGCFWHRHARCRKATAPKTNKEYWCAKFLANVTRDRNDRRQLRALGWRNLVIWECWTIHADKLERRLERFLRSGCSGTAKRAKNEPALQFSTSL